MSESNVVHEEPLLSYSFKSPSNGRTYTKHIYEGGNGFYKIVTNYRGSKFPPRTGRQPGGIIFIMLQNDLETVVKVDTKQGRFISSFSYYNTCIETNVPNETILLSIDEKGKYVVEAYNLAYFD